MGCCILVFQLWVLGCDFEEDGWTYVSGFVVCCIVNWLDNGCIKLEKYCVHETNEKEVMLSSIIKMKTLDWKRNCAMGECEKNEHKEQRVK